MTYKRTGGGVYLVVDPSMEQMRLLANIEIAVNRGIQLIQVWNHWRPGMDKQLLISAIIDLCRPAGVPVIINDDTELLTISDADGIHFDSWQNAEKHIMDLPGDIIIGITCGNDLKAVKWAHQHRLSYVSFCSMFPSASAGSCEIIDPSVIARAASNFDMQIFVSGGITPENLSDIPADAKFNGIAVISGIMSAEDPGEKVDQYISSLNQRVQHSIY